MNKKNTIIALFILVILVFLFFIYKKIDLKEEIKISTNKEQSISLNEDLILASSFEVKVMDLSDPYVKFDVKYPYFKNTNDEFNLKIENLIKDKIDESKKTSQDNWLSRFNTQIKGDNISKTPTDEKDKLSFFSDFTVIQSNSTYISFILKYGGFSGGAHGYENNISFNYDVKNQKYIELKDLFINDPEYLTFLSNKSREYLKNKFSVITEEDKKDSDPKALEEYIENMNSMIDDGTEPNDKNFDVFTFTGDKIRIYFEQYQVGPYVIGMPEIEIDRK